MDSVVILDVSCEE